MKNPFNLIKTFFYSQEQTDEVSEVVKAKYEDEAKLLSETYNTGIGHHESGIIIYNYSFSTIKNRDYNPVLGYVNVFDDGQLIILTHYPNGVRKGYQEFHDVANFKKYKVSSLEKAVEFTIEEYKKKIEELRKQKESEERRYDEEIK